MDSNLSPIVEYIKQNRDTYTREAITERLLASGYKPEDVEAAWQAAEQAAFSGSASTDNTLPTSKDDSVVRNPVFWLSMLGLTAVAYGLAYVIYSIIFSGDASPLGTDGGLALTITAGGLVVAALVVGFLVLHKNKALGMGLLIGALISGVVAPFAAVALLYGVCLRAYG